MKDNCILNRVCDLRRSQELVVVQVAAGGARPFGHGTACSLKMGKTILALVGVLLASACISPSLHAGIIYTAGSDIVSQNGIVSVPITVSVTPDLASKNWLNAGFTLTWDSSVLSLQTTSPVSVSLGNSGLPLNLGNFGWSSSSPGALVFSWFFSSFPGSQVTDGSTLFTVNFTAIGSNGSSTALNATTPIDTIIFSDFSSSAPTFVAGQVTVVPEPIGWALGLFACVFVGGATVKWVSSNRRMASGVARTGLHSGLGT